jgi:hypothetical protein
MLDENVRNPLGLAWSDLVGKYVLVGLTVTDSSGNVVEQTQVHGRITHSDAKRGLTIRLEGARTGDTYSLPPDLRSLKPAPKGEYRMRSSGEIVRDPDYLATWTIERPDA